MMLAYSFPLLSVFFSIMWFFLFVMWIMTVFHVIGDVFRSRDMGGFAKALWFLFVVAVPFLGVFCYLVVRGGKMGDRAVEDARARDEAFQSYVREAAGTTGPADQLARLASLRDAGVISPAEFEAGKAKVLG